MREQCYINTHIIDRFPGLRKIDLSKNRLREIPKEIGTLKRLEELNLQENNITRIPVEIGELPSLEVLDLSRNSLVEIPLAIADLPRLRRLLLAGNRLDNIPLYAPPYPRGQRCRKSSKLTTCRVVCVSVCQVLARWYAGARVPGHPRQPALADELHGLALQEHHQPGRLRNAQVHQTPERGLRGGLKLMFVGNGNAPLFLSVRRVLAALLTLWPHFDR